jgi:hypothetical protein
VDVHNLYIIKGITPMALLVDIIRLKVVVNIIFSVVGYYFDQYLSVYYFISVIYILHFIYIVVFYVKSH